MRFDVCSESLPAHPSADALQCPMCQDALIRERRRVVDRLRSLFGPVRRYRCANFSCQWQGNIADRRANRPESGPAGRASPRGHDAKRPIGRVPAAFVVHMLLVVVGVVVVLVFSTMEPTSWSADSDPSSGATSYEPVVRR